MDWPKSNPTFLWTFWSSSTWLRFRNTKLCHDIEIQIILGQPRKIFGTFNLLQVGLWTLGSLTLWKANSFIGRPKSWLEQVFHPSTILSEPSSTPHLPSHNVSQTKLSLTTQEKYQKHFFFFKMDLCFIAPSYYSFRCKPITFLKTKFIIPTQSWLTVTKLVQ